MFGIEETAMLETATETLAELIGYLSAQIGVEEELPAPNLAKIAALRAYQLEVVRERKAITPDTTPHIIDKALYVYAFLTLRFPSRPHMCTNTHSCTC